MIFEHISKNKKVFLIISFIILILGILVLVYSPILFQEGNPWPQIKGITQLTFGRSDIVTLSGSGNGYLTKSQGGPMAIEAFMKDRGYEYTDQMGSGYLYKSSDKTVVLTRRQYSRFYTIWTITEHNNDSNNNLWTTTTNNEGITFQYPKEILAKYISEAEWPPVVLIDQEIHEFVCEETPVTSSLAERTMRRVVDDRVYCLHATSEGAAGSVYTNYTYSALWDGKFVSINFTLQYPRCDNYDEPKQTECQKERESFDLDGIVDRIFSSLEIF